MISSFNNSQDGMGNTVAATKRLARAMMVSAGAFSLILVSCNSPNRQQQVLNLLTEFSSAHIQEIVLPPATETLYTTISTRVGVNQPDVLMVRGLETVIDINELIISTNLMRDEFRKQFHCPLVLWVNDEILRKLVWLAPDLKDWAASTIRFDVPNSQTLEQQVLSA